MSRSQSTLQEHLTTLSAGEVLAAAKTFFSSRNSLYASFLEQESASHVTFRGQGGEEIIIAASARDGGTLVSGSTYLYDMQVARFFTTLASVESSKLLGTGATA